MDDVRVITVANLIELCKENNISNNTPMLQMMKVLDNFSLVRK